MSFRLKIVFMALCVLVCSACVNNEPDLFENDLDQLTFSKIAEFSGTEDAPEYLYSLGSLHCFISYASSDLIYYDDVTRIFTVETLLEDETILYAGFDKTNSSVFTISVANNTVTSTYNLRVFSLDAIMIWQKCFNEIVIITPFDGSYYYVIDNILFAINSKGEESTICKISVDSQVTLRSIDGDNIYLYMYSDGELQGLSQSRDGSSIRFYSVPIWDSAAHFTDEETASITVIGRRYNSNLIERAKENLGGSIQNSEAFTIPKFENVSSLKSLVSFQQDTYRILLASLIDTNNTIKQIIFTSLDENYMATGFVLIDIDNQLPLHMIDSGEHYLLFTCKDEMATDVTPALQVWMVSYDE